MAAPDPSNSYTLVRAIWRPGRTAAKVDRPVWRHWLTIYKPGQVSAATALLFSNGGSNSTSPPTPDAATLAEAAAAGTVFADLGQAPNQPLPHRRLAFHPGLS